jgi:hypothetical protein
MISDDGNGMLALALRMSGIVTLLEPSFTSNAVMHSSAMARALSRLSSMLRKKEE